jgi:Bacterial SH3 domain
VKIAQSRCSMTRKMIASFLVLGALGLASCDDSQDKKKQAGGAPEPIVTEARRAAEEQVRARLRVVGDMHLRAVQVFRQQNPDTMAVCGQINPTGAASDPFIPWVAVVTLKEGRAVQTDLVLGASNTEATRVYIESVDHCFDGGGPSVAHRQAPRALPPLPMDVSLAQQAPPVGPASSVPGTAAAQPQPPAPALSSTTATGSVTTTAAHPVNIRSQPGGGGAVVRIVPRASVLHVFGEAPGGWLQVGEDQPFGWVHESMLER